MRTKSNKTNTKDLTVDKLGGKDGGKYDEKGNSSHYQAQFMEFVRDQERKYGTIVALLVCQSNVDKYNQRAGVKEGVPAEKDLTKRDWYFKAMLHFKAKIQHFKTTNSIFCPGKNQYVFLPEEVVDLIKVEYQGSLNSIPDYIPLSIAIEQK